MRFQIQTKSGKAMKKIPNAAVSGLIRIIPILIDLIPTTGQSPKVRNAIRLAKKWHKKLSSLKEL